MAAHDLDMTVNEGEMLGLIGPNGAGKTTLFNMVAGYYRTDKGQVIFQNHDITGLRPYEVCRRGIGRTFQTTKLFLDMSILENVVIGGFMQAYDISHRKCFSSIVEVNVDGFKTFAQLSDFLIFHAENVRILNPLY